MRVGIQNYCDRYQSEISIDLLPLADGGDGTVEAIHIACGGDMHVQLVHGAFDEERLAVWLDLKDTVIVELASACGISGLSNLDALAAHTRGLGEIIRLSIEKTNPKEIFVMLGGSASTDGGSAALAEMGAKFFDSNGAIVIPQGGVDLQRIHSCDLSALSKIRHACKMKVATDVANPLLGPYGAARIFGPQKGADEQEVVFLEESLAKFADLLESAVGASYREIAGSGAAGGTAFGLACAFGAEIVSGFEFIARQVDLLRRVTEADIVLSAEGRIDRSSLFGKVTGSLLKECEKLQKPLYLLAARVDQDLERNRAGTQIIQVVPDGRFAESADISSAVFELLRRHNRV